MRYRKYKRRTMNKSIPKTKDTEPFLDNNSGMEENRNSENTMTETQRNGNEPGEEENSNDVSCDGNNSRSEEMDVDISGGDISADTSESDVILVDKDQGTSSNSSKVKNIIDLDEYEEKKKKRKCSSNRCINYECESGENFQRATLFCLTYYRVKAKPSKMQEVCEECFNTALKYYERLATSLSKGEYLIDQDFPMPSDFVEIIDSDEEICEEIDDHPTEYYDKESTDSILNNLADAMNKVMNQYNFKDQIDYAIDTIEQRSWELGEEFSTLDSFQNELQKNLDNIRTNLYNNFKPEIMPMPAVEIFDTDLPRPKLTPLPKVTREAERRSNRNVYKPPSYCELTDDIDPISTKPVQQTTQKSQQQEDEIQLVLETKLPLQTLPPLGELVRSKPAIGETYYAMKSSVFSAWGKCRLTEIIQNKEDQILYRVKFDGKAKGLSSPRLVTGKQLAEFTVANVRLDVGVRVIAVFVDDSSLNKDAYFTGIIAEPLSGSNKFRYLVFFDDGYAQYVPHSKVRVVLESSKNVWEDVHPDSKLFIKKYLENYPDRPMVKLQVGQVVKTEWNGKWWVARAVKIEGSLVQMYFDADARVEWIYRGSTRLSPLFLETLAATNRQEKGPHIPRFNNMRKNSPYVEYTRSQNDTEASANVTEIEDSPSTSSSQDGNTGATAAPRAVARKSTNRPANTIPGQIRPPSSGSIVPFLPTSMHQPQSKVVYFTPKSVKPPKPYAPHECSLKCKEYVTLPLSALKGYNPLSKPLLCGWYRLMSKYKSKKEIRYRAPCGRMIRNMPELHRYLRTTESDMSVDMFDFDFWVHCLAEFVLDKSFRSKRDISNGVENVPIPCVNYVDHTLPDFTNYSTRREPMEGVNLNLDEEFLCGCDCEDDCADKQKCSCWQLTIREARTLSKKVPDELIGYTYKRLPEFVTTGIYECNKRCKCGPTCLNRVVQHPLQLKLQLFKTANRGWGIRCLNDIPQGAFICIYAGSLLTDKMANEGGMNYGDEYLAELDYIEVVERQKDGYESDVTDIEDEGDDRKDEDDEDYEEDDADEDYREGESSTSFRLRSHQDREYISSASSNVSDSPIRTRSRKRNSIDTEKPKEKKEETSQKNESLDDTVTISDDEENLRQPSRFDPSAETDMNDTFVPKFKSVRKMFGEDEVCYIMDAKNTGNIGRFLNHSCSPNVFVQNVFVDTHDLRFPWVAFFAMNYIRAGTELTWNYNYDVGSVPNKVIFCHCGSPSCRGRLL